jgi:RNA polymerase sigma-70 factor (ECF subfamily)
MGTGPETSPTDAEVVTHSHDHPEEFAVIFERHAPAVRRFLVRQCGPSAVDDLVSEVFLTAFRGRHRFDPAVPDARPWLYGVAVNVLRHHRRTEARGVARTDRVRRTWTSGVGRDVADEAVSSSEVARIRSALDDLDDRYRDVLVLLAGPGLTYDEVAAALGLPIGTVRSRASRGRERLRELLADGGPAATEVPTAAGPRPNGATDDR